MAWNSFDGFCDAYNYSIRLQAEELLLWDYANGLKAIWDDEQYEWIEQEFPNREWVLPQIIAKAKAILESKGIVVCNPQYYEGNRWKACYKSFTVKCRCRDCLYLDCNAYDYQNFAFIDSKYPFQHELNPDGEDNTDPYMILLDMMACCDIEKYYPKQAQEASLELRTVMKDISELYAEHKYDVNV